MGWSLWTTPCIVLPMVVVFPLLALLLSAHPTSSGIPQGSFEQIAKRADAARAADRMEDAIGLYTAGVRLRPSWSDGWWSLGSLFYDQDRFPEAEAAFKRFVALAPKSGPAYAFLGLCEYETKDYERALQHLQTWSAKGFPGTTDLIDVAVFHWALLLTRKGRFVESLYLLAVEAGKLRGGPALVEAMGLASLRMPNLPEDYPPERREMVWLAGEAALYSALPSNDSDRAAEYARRLLFHYDHEPNVHYFRGTVLNFERKSAEAEEEFRQELQISPRHVPAMVELARLNLSHDQTAEALSFAKSAAEIEPKNPEAHHMLGRVLLTTKQLPESARELETAKQLAPDVASIRYHLARAYAALGRAKEADREVAAYHVLRDKQQVLAPPQEKLGALRKPTEPPE